MPHRVIIAGLFHETHTFLGEQTPLSAFQVRVGDELFNARGDGSPLAGILDIADESSWEVTPVIDLRATPSGIASDSVFELFWSEWMRIAAPLLKSKTVDGIALVLHGAMVTESIDDVEGEILARIRTLPGGERVPICGVLDLHGNISPRTIELSDGFVAYRRNPHTDACDAARDGARLLQRIMQSGQRPTSVWAQPAIMWPPTGTATADEPMRSLERIARQIEESHSDVAVVNVFAGFSFADTAHTGVSFSITTFGSREQAERLLEPLVEHATLHQQLGNQVPTGLQRSATLIQQRLAVGATPYVLVEPADNIGGGAPGDTTDILRFVCEYRIDGSVVVINDPDAVLRCRELGVGGRGRLSIGGKLSADFCQPVDADISVVSLSDGRFELEDHHSHLASMCGIHIDMGPTAVVRVLVDDVQGGASPNIRVILTSQKTPPFDLGQLRSQGIEPRTCRLIGVKAAVAHRQAYDPITAETLTVDTAGPCSSDLRKFAFRKVRRPIFPLDEILSKANQGKGC